MVWSKKALLIRGGFGHSGGSMFAYDQLRTELETTPHRWLVTGAAGFIGSHLLETLLRLNQEVVGLDNFSTGRRKNLDQVRSLVSAQQWGRFRFMEGDISDLETCQAACTGARFVLHQAALGSVPRSIEQPLECHRSNVTGFLNMLLAARDAGVARMVYASSSAVYGDDPGLPKLEHTIGRSLSPYAASKRMNEIYAQTFAIAYGFSTIGLRYFNVFGPRQDPEGAYAAVIPKWISALLSREPVYINGDGETSRDFCFVSNVVQANLISACARDPRAENQVYNIALGERTTLNQLFQAVQESLRAKVPGLPVQQPVYREFRSGDVRHSLADIRQAQENLGFQPNHRITEGLDLAMDWYQKNLG